MFGSRADGFEEWRAEPETLYGSVGAGRLLHLPRQIGLGDGDEMIGHLKYAQATGAERVMLVCDSDGGSFAASRDLADYIYGSRLRVTTYVKNAACSGAALVFAAGHMRLMGVDAKLGTHSIISRDGSRPTSLVGRYFCRWADYLLKSQMDKLAGRKLPRRLFVEDMYYIDPAMAMRLGLADDTVEALP